MSALVTCSPGVLPARLTWEGTCPLEYWLGTRFDSGASTYPNLPNIGQLHKAGLGSETGF